MNSDEQDPRRVISKLNTVGLITIAILIGGVGGWATTTQLAGAVIAPGTIVVESNIKKVQHQTGGIVGQILVEEGSKVEIGQPLLRLDDTMLRATRGIVRGQLDELMAREARLLAERTGADTINFPEELVERRGQSSVASSITGEERLFESRSKGRSGQRAQLRERVAQIGQEVRGLTAQHDAKEEEIKFIKRELVGVEDLFQKNLTPIIRYMQLQRDKAKLEGESGQLVAEIARARGKASETELQIIQLEQEFRTEVLKESREVQGKIAEIKERLIAADDQLKRVEIRSPQTGSVHQLAAHTVGGVVSAGEAIMYIVPRADSLVVDARVAPQDIDQVISGSKVVARIMAGNQRTMPELAGTLTRISADLTRDPQTNVSYYIVRAVLAEADIRKLTGFDLVPGMTVELFIQTHERTPLEFLLKPLNEQIARTFRER